MSTDSPFAPDSRRSRPGTETVLLLTNSNSCTAAFVQRAGIETLRGDQSPVCRMLNEFQRRRDLLVGLINDIPGVSCRAPRGAFYAFPNASALKKPSGTIARSLLHEAGVAVLSGTAFGNYGEGYLRLSYATSAEALNEGELRIRECFERNL